MTVLLNIQMNDMHNYKIQFSSIFGYMYTVDGAKALGDRCMGYGLYQGCIDSPPSVARYVLGCMKRTMRRAINQLVTYRTSDFAARHIIACITIRTPHST